MNCTVNHLPKVRARPHCRLAQLVGTALLVGVVGCSGASSEDANPESSALSSLSFTLVNATNGQPLTGFDPIPSGSTITLSALATQTISIRANSAASIGSLKFQLDATYSHTENSAPYSLCGDQGANSYTPCSQLDAVGSHTLTATPYSGGNLTGTAGTPTTITFTVAAKPASHSAALAWNASTTPGVTYKVYRGSASGGPYTNLASGLTTINYTDPNVQAGTTYYYVTSAVDKTNVESSFSNQITAHIPNP